MRHYKHLSIEERENLYLLKGQGKSVREIGRILDRAPSTISRELKRGRCPKHSYLPHRAQYRYEKRRENCGPKKILSDPNAREKIRHYIEDLHWSPEQISNRLKLEGNSLQLSWITIYRAIEDGLYDKPPVPYQHRKKADYFRTKLRKKGKRRKKNGTERRQGKYPIAHSIEERPDEAQLRTAIGHFEADTVAGVRGGARLITLVDRCSRYTLATKAPDARAETVKELMIRMLGALKANQAKSVTPDRGHEFAQYAEVTEALPNITFYFPPPYSPWERGTNENTNGLLRELLPKGQDIAPVSEEDIQDFLQLLNLRPRKCLGWRTPFEVFFDLLLHLT